ncbi:hypothetical protein [Oceanobacillus neutriphilus]|uniref:Uncharacterized protein n=1 Tax=Oceanobacillus neutriphilus TaxID=531815 RepID=A0ABQ2P3A4_9BACI|nr:hypothetical protein [Oceanobacillus neutriphilus]GGP17158.1 hypothetical protein GCM10011346_51970 [Oceanobacillus neutriphilus]
MLKMYVFGEGDDVKTWVAAESKKQAIGIFESVTGLDIAFEFCNPNDYAREMDPNETMTYYHDGKSPEKDTMQNLINKYCDEPDIFATSEF